MLSISPHTEPSFTKPTTIKTSRTGADICRNGPSVNSGWGRIEFATKYRRPGFAGYVDILNKKCAVTDIESVTAHERLVNDICYF